MGTNKRIIQLRESKGWNQRELAKRINMSPSVLNRIEKGGRPIKDHELSDLANVLDVTTDYIVGRSDKPNYTAAEEKAEEDGELEKMLDDPNVTIAFKEFSDSPEENREKALEYLRWLNDQKKKNKD